jgi:hypothetical protein
LSIPNLPINVAHQYFRRRPAGLDRLGMWPSKKSIRRMVEKVHDLTDLQTGWQENWHRYCGLTPDRPMEFAAGWCLLDAFPLREVYVHQHCVAHAGD